MEKKIQPERAKRDGRKRTARLKVLFADASNAMLINSEAGRGGEHYHEALKNWWWETRVEEHTSRSRGC
jgi:hypothetical protein